MFSYIRLVALPDGSRKGIRHRAHTIPSLSSPGLPLFPQRLVPSFSLSANKMFRNKAESLHPDLSRSEKAARRKSPKYSAKKMAMSFFLPTFGLRYYKNNHKTVNMENRSLVTIANHSKERILYLLEMAREFEKKPNRRLLAEKVVATLFFEPSTRTRLSFETAANRLGARVIGFTDPKVTSSSKGETLKDTIMMVSNYADIIVMRHYLEGAARYASEVAPVPIVNAGDGANQHPSQTMLDLYSIYKTQGTLENLNIYLVGDLKYGRTVHSLLMAMRHFNPTFHFIAPDELKMPDEYKLYCEQHHIKYVEHTDFTEETIADADILYMTRVQRERFTDLMEYERVKDVYILHNKMLEHTRPNLRILHPLPRVNEIAYDVDDNEKAYYFQQAQNGLYAREAILCDVLGITLDEVKADTNK
jgi:aspartate carbamoyltransferase catalytic subunit